MDKEKLKMKLLSLKCKYPSQIKQNILVEIYKLCLTFKYDNLNEKNTNFNEYLVFKNHNKSY